jgi:hypothetical protein
MSFLIQFYISITTLSGFNSQILQTRNSFALTKSWTTDVQSENKNIESNQPISNFERGTMYVAWI